MGDHTFANPSGTSIRVTIHHTNAPDVTVTSSSSVAPVLGLLLVLPGPLQRIRAPGGRRRWAQREMVVNTSPYPVSGYFALVLVGLGATLRHGKLRPTGVHLVNPAGFTRGPLGTTDPFVVASFDAATLHRLPGAKSCGGAFRRRAGERR